MNDVKHKIAMLRRFYSPQRYGSSPLDFQRLQKIVVEGRDKEFIPLVGFRDQSAWSRRCGEEGHFTEAELKRIAKFFHLDEITEVGEEGWHLLTNRFPHEHFAVRLVEKDYGTLRLYRDKLVKPVADATRADFLHPLLSFPAHELEIDVIEIAGERGAAERDELEEQNLLRTLLAWTPYAYRVTADQTISGDVYVLEISSAIGGDRATCALIAPSNLHTRTFFTSPAVVPEAKPGSERASFRMSDKDARCTTVAFVTAHPLRDIPIPREGKYFAALSVEGIYLLAAQLAEMKSPIFRGICTLGLRS